MVVYDFYADWCGPCKLMSPIINQIESEYPHVEVVKIDADASPDLCRQHGVQGLPTFILFQDGQEVKRIVGATTKAKFVESMGLTA